MLMLCSVVVVVVDGLDGVVDGVVALVVVVAVGGGVLFSCGLWMVFFSIVLRPVDQPKSFA